eukprot:881765-Pleurochrysis_carterae.AAC.1
MNSRISSRHTSSSTALFGGTSAVADYTHQIWCGMSQVKTCLGPELLQQYEQSPAEEAAADEASAREDAKIVNLEMPDLECPRLSLECFLADPETLAIAVESVRGHVEIPPGRPVGGALLCIARRPARGPQL